MERAVGATGAPGGPGGALSDGPSRAGSPQPGGRRPATAAELMAEIRAERDLALRSPWLPSTPTLPSSRNHLVHRVELDWLHKHWAVPNTAGEADPVGGRRGWKATLALVVGRLVFGVLRTYLDGEREVVSHMVRLHDAVAKDVDALADHQEAELGVIRSDLLALAAWIDARLADDAGLGGQPARSSGPSPADGRKEP